MITSIGSTKSKAKKSRKTTTSIQYNYPFNLIKKSPVLVSVNTEVFLEKEQLPKPEIYQLEPGNDEFCAFLTKRIFLIHESLLYIILKYNFSQDKNITTI